MRIIVTNLTDEPLSLDFDGSDDVIRVIIEPQQSADIGTRVTPDELNRTTYMRNLVEQGFCTVQFLADANDLVPTPGGSGVAGSLNGGAATLNRPVVNFIEGTNVTLTVADNAPDGRIDVTIDASGGGGPVPPNSIGDTEMDKTAPYQNITRKTLTFTVQASDPITTGRKGNYLLVPADMTVVEWSVVADVSGTIVLDVWQVNNAGFPPTVANSIVAAAPPQLSAAQRATSTTLTGWTTALNFGDWLGFAVTSTGNTIRSVTLQLHCVIAT